MRRNRRRIKNRIGCAILSFLLIAALIGGNLTSFATDVSTEETVTEETGIEDSGAVAEDTVTEAENTTGEPDTTGDSENTDSQDSGNSATSDDEDSEASAAENETTVDASQTGTVAADASQDDAEADTDDEDSEASAAENETTVDASQTGTAAADASQDDAEADTGDEDSDEETGDTLHEDGLSDDTADVETAADWEATLPDELTGVWADDLIEVAKSQLGYKESTKNYRVNDAGKHKGYTRYGAWYGDPYGDWCAMFVSFCLHYTDIPRSEFPEAASCWAWTKTLDKLDMYEEADSGYEPVPGDLIFFDNNSKNEKPVDHVGIVTEITEETESDGSTVTRVHTIEGNSGNMVREREYDITDDRIVGYGVLPENPDLEEETEEEAKEKAEEETEVLYGLDGGYDGSDSLDDPDTAGSCVGRDEVATIASVAGDGWSMDDYYVGESDQYTVSKTDNFSLKYQVEFHVSEDLEVGAVVITIDASLGTYRDGSNILPTDLGIPYGTPDNPTSTSSSPFNYYYIDETGAILTASEAKTASGVQLVIWNYKEIVSGTNTMFQVLFNSLDVMDIPDETSWSLDITTSVNGSSVSGHTLSGSVDTSATLSSVSKTAYTAVDTSYTPELYSEKQVSTYISGDIPDPYATDFDDYIYIVWYVTLKGSATQPYEITIDESTFTDLGNTGSVVGYKVYTSGTTNGVSYTYDTDADGNPTLTFSSSTQRSFNAAFYVVTAYDADTYELDSEIENDVTATLHPVDGKDADTVKSDSATTTWVEYVWHYRGNVIGTEKWHKIENGVKVSSGTYDAHLDLYKINSDLGVDTGEYEYSSESTDRGYGLTHILPEEDEDGNPIMTSDVGEWIEGTYYTTTSVDDVLYVYPDNEKSDACQLTKEDYYFSSVSIVTNDYGYDIWEDETTAPNVYAGVDQNVYIYAMFADGNGSGTDDSEWELVATVPFSESGIMSYTFTESDLARQPYRVKAVHSTADYVTYCTIKVGVTLRYDSPILQQYIEEYGDDLTLFRIENLSGVAGQVYSETEEGVYFQDQSTDDYEQYSALGLEEFTRNLYNTILMRDNAYVDLTELAETASAYKSVTTENDAEHGRVLANYYLTAYEAYYVTGESTVDALKENGVYLPARNDVSYYDLLPYGMEFNPDTTVVAGRITTMNTTGTWRTNSGAWNKNGVSVTVTEDDVYTNWNGTGRTMVVFHIHYDGDDASSFYDVPNSDDDLWFEGFGLYFQAYYDWANLDEVDVEYNIAAYIAENVTDESEQFLGLEDYNIYRDDGTADSNQEGEYTAQYAPFYGVSDLNGDGVTDWYTNMYCSTITSTNVATASSDSITKKVRADDDAVAEYGSRTAVGEGKGYTYEIQLTNTENATLSDIVIFDHLEYAVEDGRTSVEGSGSVYDGVSDSDIENHWTGTFLSVTTTALEDLGIAPVVYYNASRDATVSSGEASGKSVLTSDNGWYTEEEFVRIYGSLSEAKAIAVDLSTRTDGSAFTLGVGESLSFQIHMLAPDGSAYRYAFNNPMYYTLSTPTTGAATSATLSGDSVRVELGEAETLEVVKEVDPGVEVPDSMVNQRFTFEITRAGEILANQEYMTYTYNEDTGEWESTGVVGSTGVDGQFQIRANQKAVFSDLVDIEDVVVTEVDSVMWDVTYEGRTTSKDENGNTVYTDTFVNRYRSPVYLYKTALTTGTASSSTLSNARFTFFVEVDPDRDGEYEPYVGEYIYVKSVLTDGSSPSIDTSKGDNGYGYTEDGYVTLGVDDIIVFFPTDEEGYYTNIPYRVTETEVQNADDWVCEEDTTSGTTRTTGTSVTIENYYKYRSLIITKDLADYDHNFSDCDSEWTFRLTDENGAPVVGNHWYLIDSSGDTIEGSGGYLDEDGEFTFSGAGTGCRVVVEGLVMGEEYTITEVDWDETLFEVVSDSVTVTMPTYSTTRNATITNRYLLKDLEVSKLVLSADTSSDVTTTEFTFTLQRKEEDGTYTAMGDVTYTVDGEERTTAADGTFTLKSGETAVFDDIGYQGDEFRVIETANETYPQIYPSSEEGYDSTLGSEGDSVRFINGDFEEVVVITKELSGVDDVGTAYVDYVKADNTRTSLAGGEGDDFAYTVDVTFGIYDGDELVTSDPGAMVEYSDGNDSYPYVYIKVTQSGEVTLYSYNGGLYTETISPYDSIYLARIGGYTVKASENDDMALVIYEVSDSAAQAIGSDEIISTGSVMEGSAAANEDIVLVNEIGSANRASEIYKLMTEGSAEVMTGSEITFRVEVYDAATGTWMPASGIRYITMDGCTGVDRDESGLLTSHICENAEATSGILTTGGDGQITLVKSDNGYPYIRFVDDEVYVNVYDGMVDGQLRIVELTYESDDEWGWLVGYDGEGWVGGPALTVTYGDTFVNGNDEGLVFEVEKEMYDNNESDQEFTFHLVHVISADTSPIGHLSEINDSEAGANVYYVIYDVSTGARIGDGYTDENGCFTLQAGQYARFYVPAGTTWYVYEGILPSWVLMEVTDNYPEAPNASIVDDVNGVVQDADSVYATGTIILTLTDADTQAALSGGTFDLYKVGEDGGDVLIAEGLVTDKNGQIIVKGCDPGTYYFKETAAPSGYNIPDVDTSDTVTVPEGLKKVTEYEVTMENETAPGVKYAVKLWGICADTYSYDEGDTTDTASLTFGPATGADHLTSYVECTSDTCIHKLSWDEIIELCEANQGDYDALYALFGSCLENGCTKAVNLTPNETLFNMTTVDNYLGNASYTGDGVSTLNFLLNGTGSSSYIYGAIWNYSYTDYSASDPANVYSRSRIRTTLTGDQSNIDEWRTDNVSVNDYYGYSTLCDESNCLFSCFPANLQEAMVPRTTLNSGNATSGLYQDVDTKTTYDKLFLFSIKETGYTYAYDEGGGDDYGVNRSDSDRVAYEFSGTSAMTSSCAWWSRSRSSYDNSYACFVNTSGTCSIYTYVSSNYGLSPGFCIK